MWTKIAWSFLEEKTLPFAKPFFSLLSEVCILQIPKHNSLPFCRDWWLKYRKFAETSVKSPSPEASSFPCLPHKSVDGFVPANPKEISAFIISLQANWNQKRIVSILASWLCHVRTLEETVAEITMWPSATCQYIWLFFIWAVSSMGQVSKKDPPSGESRMNLRLTGYKLHNGKHLPCHGFWFGLNGHKHCYQVVNVLTKWVFPKIRVPPNCLSFNCF